MFRAENADASPSRRTSSMQLDRPVTGAGRRRYEVGSHDTRAKYGMEA